MADRISTTLAVTQTQYTDSNIAVAINLPSPAVDNDIYFSLRATTDASWVGFGFGDEMAGSLIFVVYTSVDGANVTVSPRTATGHVMPQYLSAVNVTVLSGSGMTDTGGYVVNAHCKNCRSWPSGTGEIYTIDMDSATQPMIYAIGPSEPVFETDDLDFTIQQHQYHDTFSLDLHSAIGAGGVPTANLNNDNGFGPPNGFGDDDNDPASIARRVHAAFMIGAFFVGFHLGYLILRVFERVLIHAIIQSLAAIAVIIGMVAGIVLSVRQDIVSICTVPDPLASHHP